MRRPAAFLAAAFALALAVVVTFWFSARSGGVGAARPEDAAAISLGGEPRAGSGDPVEAQGERSSAGRASPAAGAEADGDAGATVDSGARRVRVVRSPSLAPLPGVEVLWWPELPFGSTQADELERWTMRSGPDEELPEGAQRVVSDAQGFVALPDAEHGVRVLARRDGWFGIAHFAAGETPPMRIELRPELAVSARVLDAAGAPVEGAFVAVYAEDGSTRQPLVRARSDSNGIARLAHWRWALAGSALDGHGVSVGIDGVFESVETVAFRADDPPREPIELRAPAFGSCEVHILGRDGQLAIGPYDVKLGLAPEDSDGNVDPDEVAGLEQPNVLGGIARFEQVALGRRLVALAWQPEIRIEHRRVVDGPRAPGQGVRIELRTSELACITARVLHEDGAPLASAPLGLQVFLDDEPEGFPLGLRPRTDADGRFAIDLDHLEWAPDIEIELSLAQLAPDGSQLATARCKVPLLLKAGANELGNLKLVPLPVFATGRVVDSAGAPVGGAWVRAESCIETGTLADPDCSDALPLHSTRTAADGRFVLRLPGRIREANVTAVKDTLGSPEARASAGASDVVLTLAEFGELAGRLVLPVGVSTLDVRIDVDTETAGTEIEHEHASDVRLEPDGSFLVRGLGTGSFLLTVRSENATLARVEGVAARKGERVRDPRLDPLDLSEALRMATLTITDQAGTLLTDGVSVWTIFENDASGGGEVEVVNGRATIVFRNEAPSVQVRAEGYVAELIDELDGDRTVVLRRRPSVRLRLPPTLELPALPFELLAQLRQVRGAASTTCWFQPGGVAQAELDAFGEYEVRYYVRRQPEDGEPSPLQRLNLPQPVSIHVRDVPGTPLIDVPLDPDSLAAALRALGGG